MWQCKNCKERFIEEPVNHVCVDDSLKPLFKGRKALLEPIYRYFIQKISRINDVRALNDGQNINLVGPEVFAIIRVTEDSLEVCLTLDETTPLPPNVHSSSRLIMPWATHYFTISSVKDINTQSLQVVKASYDFQKGKK